MNLAPGQISLNTKRYWTRSRSDDNGAVRPSGPAGGPLGTATGRRFLVDGHTRRSGALALLRGAGYAPLGSVFKGV